MGDKGCLNIQLPKAYINMTDTLYNVSIHKNMTPIEYNFAIYMHFFKYTMKVFIFSFHQVILGFVMEEALFFMTLPLHCNIFLIHVPFPFETIFLPNSHEFSKANCDTSGFLLSFS